ncbi:MAG: DUF1972 domain-containing protein [Cytophagales bacterium]|nr:DUF1972 domain-containing protein [Cytophagales bacterium]
MKQKSKRKRVAIIGAVGIPSSYGGFETLADCLAKHLAVCFSMTVYCSSYSSNAKPKYHNKAELHYIPLKANGFQGIFYDIWSCFHAIRKHDTLLILGVTGMVILPILSLFKVKTIVHIDGLEWRRDKWRPFARKFLKLSERIAIKHADEIILDNLALRDMVLAEYPKRQYQLITYGSETNNEGYQKHFTSGLIPREEYAMALCRIVPENNVKTILDTFKESINLNLIFVGNWLHNGYSKDLFEKYKLIPNIDLRHPIYDASKVEALRKKCKVYIHGHSAGGTNPSLVEAMRSGVPVIAKDVSFNRVTMHSKGLYFSDKADLVSQLNELEKHDLSGLGKRLETVAIENYSWEHIAEQYRNIF